MDPEVLAGNSSGRVPGWSVVWAMASAAMPKSEERRQHLSAVMGGMAQNNMGKAQGPPMVMRNGATNMGGTVQLGIPEGKRNVATAVMVEGQTQRGIGKPNVHVSGKGGWLPWSTRRTGIGTQSTQIDQPKDLGIQKKGLRSCKKHRTKGARVAQPERMRSREERRWCQRCWRRPVQRFQKQEGELGRPHKFGLLERVEEKCGDET